MILRFDWLYFSRDVIQPSHRSQVSGDRQKVSIQFHQNVTQRETNAPAKPAIIPWICRKNEIMQRVNSPFFARWKWWNNIVIHFINVSDMSFFFNPMMRLFPRTPWYMLFLLKLLVFAALKVILQQKRFSWNLLKSTWNIHITLHSLDGARELMKYYDSM
jgi:hypothetical protein